MILGRSTKTTIIRSLGISYVMLQLAVPAKSQNFTWNFQKLALTVSSSTFHVVLSDLGSKTDYIIGVRSDAGTQGSLIAGQVQYSTGGSSSFRVVSGIVDWPASQINIQAGAVTLSGLSQLNGSILIYVNVPSGTKVYVDGPSYNIASVTVGTSLLVQNGVIRPEEVKGISTLTSWLMTPNGRPNAVEVFTTATNQNFATPKGLATHIINFTKPSYPGGTAPRDATPANLKIVIDQFGSIQSIVNTGGDANALAACADAIRQWKFRPFIVNRNAVSVNAPVVFFFARDGTVSSPILTAMGN